MFEKKFHHPLICPPAFRHFRESGAEGMWEFFACFEVLKMAKEKGFRVMQFNAVVASNTHALHLYERIGFTKLGVIPGGFRMPDGHYEDIIPHYYVL